MKFKRGMFSLFSILTEMGEFMMKRDPSFFPCFMMALALWIIGGTGTRSSAEICQSPSVIISNKNGSRAYVAETGANQVAVIDLENNVVERHLDIPHAPSGLALSKDENQLFVTGGGAKGMLMKVDLQKNCFIDSFPVGHTPIAPVLSTDGNIVYICSRFDNCLVVVDLHKGSLAGSIQVKREPVDCGLSPDGSMLFVANHLPAGSANLNDIAAEVSVVDTALRKVVKSIRLPNGSTSLRGLCFSPDGKYVYVTHILGRYTMPTTQLERGWMNTNALSIIDAGELSLVNTVLLDEINAGAANPWDVSCSVDGKTLCVTHAGTHEVSIIDRQGLHDKLASLGHPQDGNPSPMAEDIPNTLSFLGTHQKKIRLRLNGPRGCAIAGSMLVVSGYFSDNLEVINLAKGQTAVNKVIPLAPEQSMSQVRRGEMLFNDAELCFQKWQSCSSCHPDARADGLNWDLLNDGLGNPKNTKSLLLSHMTPPVMITGIRADAETAVRSGIKYIQFTTCSEEDAKAIDAYLRSLNPVESPSCSNEAVQRGKIVYEKADCAKCHSGQCLTDQKKYDVGTGLEGQTGMEFDTPTLVEIWRTAPYLYDGRAATIEEVIGKYNPHNQHGNTRDLTEQERNDLAAYLLSL